MSLSHARFGTGDPLVILHGLFGSKRNWAGVAARLAADRGVLVADLRNHGESPWDEQHDYPAMAADVAGLIDREVGGPAAVLGHSMGGKVAMTLALMRPDLVERLVVVDIAPVRSSGTLIDVLRAMRAVPLKNFSRRTEVEAALVEAIPDAAVRGFLMLNLVNGSEGLAWTVNLDALERHFDTILGFPEIPAGQTFDGPTLFVVGGRSEYVRPEHRAEIRRLFPGAGIEVLEGAGHWVHADAPGPFVETVRRFLAGG
ncbi:MAG: alpha/beta fold hydrolase [Pirellulales bacterium]